MTLRNRFLIVWFGVVLFILLTPIIVLYALGYKFDLSTRQITKTGSLIIRSEPTRANIYINDKLQKQTTNATLRFLIPGDYNVKVSSPGYQSWTKRLNIRSGLVTWANHERDYISLFFENPELKLARAISLSAVSVKENSAVIADGQKISLYNPNRGELEQIENRNTTTFAQPVNIQNTDITYHILRYPNAQNLAPDLLNTAKQMESNNNYTAILSGTNLYYQKGLEINQLSTSSSGFTLENEHLWYLEGSILKHANLNLNIIETIATIDHSPLNSKIIRAEGRIFLLLDQTLYVLNDKLEELYRGVTYAYWDNASKRLLFANNNEALIFDPSSFKTELIIRSSTPISQPILNRTTGYLFFLNENRLKAIELDGRDHRNVYTIIETPANFFLISDNGKLATLFTEAEVTSYTIRD